MNDTAKLVAEIDALYQKATKGPWAVDPDNRPGMSWNNHIVSAFQPYLTVCFMAHSGKPDNSECEANANVIVAFFNNWPQIREALLRAGD